MKLLIWFSIFALLLAIFLVEVYAAEYQTFRKDKCEWCGTKGSIFNQLNVHHIQPQHLHPELRDAETNLVTLCRRCHFTLGHKNNWTNSVPEIAVLFKKGDSGK